MTGVPWASVGVGKMESREQNQKLLDQDVSTSALLTFGLENSLEGVLSSALLDVSQHP